MKENKEEEYQKPITQSEQFDDEVSDKNTMDIFSSRITPQTPEWETTINKSFNIVVKAILDCINKKITDQERDLIIETESEKGKDVIKQALSQAEERGRSRGYATLKNKINSILTEFEKPEDFVKIIDETLNAGKEFEL